MPSVPLAVLSALVLMMGTVACEPVEPLAEPSPLAPQHQELEGINGLSLNGLSLNGLSLNGLSLNGLSLNGLSAAAFTSWFAKAPAHSDMVMRYIVGCALPAGQSRTYTDARRRATYTWHGGLGLAPAWTTGQPATLAEQQLVSACLAAHANKLGRSVSISVLGQDAAGQPIAFSEEELQNYSRREACFFGNLFTNEGVFFGLDGSRLQQSQSSPRACTVTSEDPSQRNACSPMRYAGLCSSICESSPDSPFYLTCVVNGVTYPALTTRVRQADIYTCGDGTCQLTESCGQGSSARSCRADCGSCSGEEDDEDEEDEEDDEDD